MTNTENKIFIGRQGIYDSRRDLFGYELLYHDKNSTNTDKQNGPAEYLLNSFLETGIEPIVGPHKALISLTQRYFKEQPPLPFEKEQVLLRLQDTLTIDEKLIEQVKKLTEQGHHFVIGNFASEEKFKPLIPYASFAVIDGPSLTMQSHEGQLNTLKQYPVRILAEKIETREQFDKLKSMDIDYFQGTFFSRPDIIATKKIEQNEIVVLQLLAKLNDPDVTIDELNHLIEQDPALSYKILRLINSAAFGLRRKVESIKQAVIFLGLKQVKAWASMLAISNTDDGNKDIMLSALLRAYMCQALIEKTDTSRMDTAFTVGTLSILDRLMHAPLATILAHLPLADEIVDALLNHNGVLGEALACSIAYEQLDFEQAHFPVCNTDCLNEVFLNSSHEAFRAVMGMNE